LHYYDDPSAAILHPVRFPWTHFEPPPTPWFRGPNRRISCGAGPSGLATAGVTFTPWVNVGRGADWMTDVPRRLHHRRQAARSVAHRVDDRRTPQRGSRHRL